MGKKIAETELNIEVAVAAVHALGEIPPGSGAMEALQGIYAQARSQEVRRATLIINYTPKTQRKISQRELELEISHELDNIPDTHFWFLDDQGNRAISLIVAGTKKMGCGRPNVLATP